MADLPNRIREHRKAQGLTLDQLAAKMDCSTPQVSDLERGVRGLDLTWMRRAARALGVQPGDLLIEADSADSLSPDERRLLDCFRSAAPAQQRQMLAMAEVINPPSTESRAA